MIDALEKPGSKSWKLLIGIALLAGILLRLSFPTDIEYKYDEHWMFDASQKIGVSQPWPWVGMTSGPGVPNPGLSVWVFVVLAHLFHATTPPDLARAVQVLNLCGLFLLAFFSLRILPLAERTPWLWATALAAVNPFAMIFQRKIWAQSTLPFFCVLFWMAWHYRKTRWGAFFWGLLGASLGQIHMSGFFFAGGVFLWTVLYDRKAKWGAWFAGSVLGAIALIPWLQCVIAQHGQGTSVTHPEQILYPKYWIFFISDSLGMGLTYSIKTQQFLDYIRYPLVGGVPTYLAALAHVVIVGAGIALVVSAVRKGLSWDWLRDRSETGLSLNSAFVSTGLLMTLACVLVCRHYLIVTFPLEWVWLSRIGLADKKNGTKYLTAIWVAQLALSVVFLLYIHIHHGDPGGDYGVPYEFQTP